jgi:poly-gamma-glutamate synthesis protein (capsule biosynthesis protein)
VNLLPGLCEAAAAHVQSQWQDLRQPNDVVVVSVHWGGNWGYPIPDDHRMCAHELIQRGADIVHGHCSRHRKGIEI